MRKEEGKTGKHIRLSSAVNAKAFYSSNLANRDVLDQSSKDL
jgi:hypothetical protein